LTGGELDLKGHFLFNSRKNALHMPQDAGQRFADNNNNNS